MNKDKISIALSKQLIPKINDKCRRINRNRSNYIETVLIQDLQKDETKHADTKDEIAMKLG